MAVVHLATDLKHGRLVALKVLRPEIAGSLAAERFLQEIRIIAGLTHPNILPLHDSGRVGDLLYYVMPYVEGSSLRSVLQDRGPLPIAEAVQIAEEVADALAYAHEHGVVHRDIKPENILIEAGHAIVCDFGIAKAVAEAADPDRSEGLVLGTSAYMSPEQAVGDRKVDSRADIYSLGCVLYELLIGEPPFTGPTPQAILARHAIAPPPRMLTVRGTVPETVERAVHRALSKMPADRFGSAREFSAALARAPAARDRLRRPAILVAVATGLLLAGFGLVSRGKPSIALNPKRVVVAPFINRTGVADLDHIGTMAADWITQGLMVTGVVEVVPTVTALQSARYVTEIAQARGRVDPIRLLSDETLAGTVISGAYYKEGGELHFQVQVTDVTQGRLLGAPDVLRSSDTTASDAIEEIRTRVMGLLARTFDERLQGFAGGARRPPRYEAYREFVEGIEAYVGNDYRRALSHFHQAFARDSTFVSALLFAALNHSNLGEWDKSDSVLQIAEPLKESLSEYDRHWFEYRRALNAQDRPRALSAIRLAAAIAPGSKAEYNLAIEALENGNVREARDALTRLHPERGAMRGWLPYWDLLASVHHLLGEHRRELSVARRAKQLYADRYLPLAMEVRALAALRRRADVDRTLLQARTLPRDVHGATADLVLREAVEELTAHGDAEGASGVADMRLQRLIETNSDAASDLLARGWALYALRRYSDVAAVADSLLMEDSTSIEYIGLKGLAAARLGDVATASQADYRLRRIPGRYVFGLHTQFRAMLAAVLGNRDSAVALLRQSLAEGRPYDLWVHRNADLESLRGYRPFEEFRRPR